MSASLDQPKPTKTQRRILAFDFGTKRIGVAVGQELTRTATPLDPLDAKDGIPDWQVVSALVEQWQPDAFVVGIPLNMDDSESEMAVRARKFSNRLHGRFHRPSYGMDERLSTYAAKSEISASGNSSEGMSVDSIAAKLILESWLQQKPEPKENKVEPDAG